MSFFSRAGSAPLTFMSIVLAGMVLFLLQPVLIPLLIAIMLSYIFSPLVEKLAVFKIPRIITLLVIFGIGFGILGMLGEALVSNIAAFVGNFPDYKEQALILIRDLSSQYVWMQDAVENVTSVLFSLPIGSTANSLINSSISFLSNTFLVLLFMTYLCLSVHTYAEKITKAFPGQKGKKILQTLYHINADINKYLVVHTLISLATGISVGAVCYFFGVPFAFLWGFLAFLLNYIPTIGSIISALPPIITAAIQLGPSEALWVALAVIGVQMIWGNIIEPKIAGDSLGISPLVILISLVFWGWLWGIVGMILAVPIASIIKITCQNIPGWKSVSVLMGD